MTPELTVLILATLLQLLQMALFSVLAQKQVGRPDNSVRFAKLIDRFLLSISLYSLALLKSRKVISLSVL